MDNVQKYLRIIQKQIRQEEKAEHYSVGMFYNSEKRDKWIEKFKKSRQEENELIDLLTEKQKLSVFKKTELNLFDSEEELNDAFIKYDKNNK